MSGMNRGSGRFEIRVYVPAPDGPGRRSTQLRTSRIELGLAGLSGMAKAWANNHGEVVPGTTVDLIDVTDGGPIAQLKFLGFGQDTLDNALNVLRTNGFSDMQQVAEPGQWLAGTQPRR